MYVTLEPCCHHGKTPPCTDAIVESGIRRMVDQLEEKPPLAWLAFKADTRLGSGKPTTGKLIYAVRDVVLRQKVPSTRL